MDEFIYEESYQYPQSLMLNVTDDCNLACRYCFVEQHPHYMTLDTAKVAVDWLYNNYLKIKELNLEKDKPMLYFFGGEPMLCYQSIIVPIVKYCEEKYPNIFQFGMTTNGTLLNKEKIDFLKNKKFNLLLSIDGAKETQDYNRPCKNGQSSFDLLEKNIAYLLGNFPNLCFRSTIYAPTVKHLFENYLYAESLGFKNYEMIEDNRHEWTEEQKEQLKNEFSKIYLYQTQQLLNNIQPLHVNRINSYLGILDNLLNEDKKDYYTINNKDLLTVKRCGLGTVTCSVGYNGDIYGCQEQTSKDNKNIFLIGNIFNGGIDIEKHKKLLEFYYNNIIIQNEKNEKCKNCLLKNMCLMNIYICPSATYDLFNNMNTMTDINCYIRQLYIKNSILHLNILKILKENNEQEEEI